MLDRLSLSHLRSSVPWHTIEERVSKIADPADGEAELDSLLEREGLYVESERRVLTAELMRLVDPKEGVDPIPKHARRSSNLAAARIVYAHAYACAHAPLLVLVLAHAISISMSMSLSLSMST